jgi:outer membrane protein assembly factor BamB
VVVKWTIKTIRNSDVIKKAILLDSLMESNGTIPFEKSDLIKNNLLIIGARGIVYCLSIPNLEKIWSAEVDLTRIWHMLDMGDDILIHGELALYKVDMNGKVKWKFEIDDDLFWGNISIQKDKIILRGEKTYHLDSYGNLIKTISEK